MGFANAEVMGGSPRDADLDRVAESYQGRLRPRHHAVARLAREGLLSCVVTTNYDLLLEGAYRVAGFQERDRIGTSPDPVPPTAVPGFSPIAGADQFFMSGESHRTALLLKIHGCVASYRTARDRSIQGEPAGRSWARSLPALVFTYREIQTWRADAWSRDLLRTLLRTSTLALCGYSGADPVMHSTFRDVYEEMAALRAGVATPAGRDPAEAPLFFFDVAGKREFHGFEILRAAAEAAGCGTGGVLGEHPNHVEFQVAADGFPTIDDHLRWLFHCVLREIQSQALAARLRRLTPRLLGHPCPDADHRVLCARFEALRAAEVRAVAAAGSPQEARQVFERTVGWTWHFLPGLLRELALAELVESQQGPGWGMRSLRRGSWYYPASDRPEWTAWTAVVELAIREMVDVSRRSPPGAAPGSEWLSAEESPHAAVSFACPPEERQPSAVCIRLAGFGRPGRTPPLLGAFRRITVWELGEQDVPWRTRNQGRCPSAANLWRYALGRAPGPRCAAHYLGTL
jgi:hypothetical protein